MKKGWLVVGGIFLTYTLFSLEDDWSSMHRRIDALAIGEMTLAYRLVALTASLAIANATDNEALFGILENVNSTLSNGKTFLMTHGGQTPFTKEILLLFDETIRCSDSVRIYTRNRNYDNLQKIRGCLDTLEGKIMNLSEQFNKTPASPKKSH